MIVRALIDYDNIRPYRAEKSRADVQANSNSLITLVLDTLRAMGHSRGELRARLYGGWLTERGEYSLRAQWLLASLDSIRGRRQAWRVMPEIALALLHCPTVPLIGSYRTERIAEQKMTDTMLAVDMLHIAALEGEQLVIVSDDDDLVPPSLASRMITKDLVLVIRRRNPGSGLNDRACTDRGVVYVGLPEDFPR